MGIETAIILGLSAFQANQEMKAAEKEANFLAQQADANLRQAERDQQALQEQTDLEQQERLKRARAVAGSQKVSFLNAGLTLEGTPEFAIDQTLQTGLEDINLAQRNTSTQIGNIRTRATTQSNQLMNQASTVLSNARSKAIGTLVSAGVSAGVGGGSFSGSGTFGSQGTVSRQIAL